MSDIAEAKRVFRPDLWLSIFSLLALALLITLGSWQLQRLAWKQALLAEIADKRSQPPISMPGMITDADIDALHLRTVDLAGQFTGDQILIQPYQTYHGSVGSYLLAGFQPVDSSVAYLINLGWLPQDQSIDAVVLPKGKVALQAVLSRPKLQHFMLPDNDPDANLWFWHDLPRMAQDVNLGSLGPMVLIMTDPQTVMPMVDLRPITDTLSDGLTNNHLTYAITWFSLAIGLIVIYTMMSFQPVSQSADSGSDEMADGA